MALIMSSISFYALISEILTVQLFLAVYVCVHHTYFLTIKFKLLDLELTYFIFSL